jgi:hypothetical protein
MPSIYSRCTDCGFGTITGGERFMVKNDVWEIAWADRFKPWHALYGQQILCIGCLESRIGRTLTCIDFTDVPLNWEWDDYPKSERLLDRLMPDKHKRQAWLDDLETARQRFSEWLAEQNAARNIGEETDDEPNAWARIFWPRLIVRMQLRNTAGGPR